MAEVIVSGEIEAPVDALDLEIPDGDSVTYLLDLLARKHNLPKLMACMAMAPRYFEDLDELRGVGCAPVV